MLANAESEKQKSHKYLKEGDKKYHPVRIILCDARKTQENPLENFHN